MRFRDHARDAFDGAGPEDGTGWAASGQSSGGWTDDDALAMADGWILLNPFGRPEQGGLGASALVSGWATLGGAGGGGQDSVVIGSVAFASSGGMAMVVGQTTTLSGGTAIAAGTTTDSSVVALAVDKARTAYLSSTGTSLTGTGLKIGILSDSFNLKGGESSAIANGDLPASSQITILKEGASGGDEGQAMAELIHQIAPGASIYFYTATGGEADFAAGITALASAGVNVIVDDVAYTNEPFYQDTGVITQAVEAAIGQGIDYFTSANNSGSNFYEAAFSPISFALPGIRGALAVHDVGGTGSPYEAVSLGANAKLDFTLEWTEPYANSRYDIGVGLYSLSGGTYTLVQSFTTTDLGGAAYLSVDTSISDTQGTYYLAFYENASERAGGQTITPGTFKIIFFQDSNATIDGVGAGVGSGTSIGHELVAAANTVAAVDVTQTPSQGVSVPVVESYSAAGSGEIYLNAGGTLLASPVSVGTPDFAATDGTPTTIFNPFFGTSAAAPNAAAVSLLMLQADSRLTPVQVTTLLDRSAIATASSLTGGAGLIQADTAVAAATLAASTPIWTAQGGTDAWSTAANWSDDALPGVGDSVGITDGIGIFTAAYTVTYSTPASTIGDLTIDGGAVVAVVPDLVVSAGDGLATGGLALGRGTIDLFGTIEDTGALVGGTTGGVVHLGSQGVLSIGGGAAGSGIAYVGVGGTLRFTSADPATLVSGLGETISNFQAGDTLDLSGLAATMVASVQVSGSVVTVVDGSGGTLASLRVSGGFSQLGFVADAGGGTELVACFLAGTQIGCAHGPVPVEMLREGDLIRTGSGALRGVRWVGRREMDLSDRHVPQADPVRIAAGAFGVGLPVRDLYVSPEHAILCDGAVLVPAGSLVNGDSIARVRMDRVQYFHVALDSHDILLAEGLPCETLLDFEVQGVFDNAGEAPEGLGWLVPCAPRLTQGRLVEAIRQAIDARCGAPESLAA